MPIGNVEIIILSRFLAHTMRGGHESLRPPAGATPESRSAKSFALLAEEGVIFGTVQYISSERAKGKKIDARRTSSPWDLDRPDRPDRHPHPKAARGRAKSGPLMRFLHSKPAGYSLFCTGFCDSGTSETPEPCLIVISTAIQREQCLIPQSRSNRTSCQSVQQLPHRSTV